LRGRSPHVSPFELTMPQEAHFFGWKVAWTAFVIAACGAGAGLYGPSVILPVLHATRGWSVSVISAAITAIYFFPCLHHHLSARAPSPPPPCDRYAIRRAVARARCHHLVHRASALAALGRAVDGCGLGHDEQRRHQCHGRSLVRSRPPKGAQSHPQWSKPRRGLVPTRLCRPHRRCRLRRLWNAGRRRSPERLAPAHGRQVCDLDPFDLPPPSLARVQHT
jgi:hypothetical protein